MEIYFVIFLSFSFVLFLVLVGVGQIRGQIVIHSTVQDVSELQLSCFRPETYDYRYETQCLKKSTIMDSRAELDLQEST